MLIRWILIIFLSVNLYAYSKKCPDKKYIDAEIVNWVFEIYYKGFFDEYDQKCDDGYDAIVFFKKTKQKFLIDGRISSVRDYYGSNLLIETYTGAHTHKLYTFSFNKNGKVILVPIIEKNRKRECFVSDYGIINTYETLVKFKDNKKYFITKVEEYDLLRPKVYKNEFFYNNEKKIYQEWKNLKEITGLSQSSNESNASKSEVKFDSNDKSNP